MASPETLVPNGDDSGWPSGTYADIDEGVPGDEVASMSTTIDDDLLILDLSASEVVDGDTVTDITINISALTTGSSGKDTLVVDLLIGGTGLGIFTTGNLTGSYATYACTNVLWNVDRTASEMAGAQVSIKANQIGKVTAATWDIDSVDVVVTFTSGGGQSIVPHVLLQHSMRN